MIQGIFTVADSIVTGFEVSGHADFADEGTDIVCAAVSSAVYMTANTITEVMALPCSLDQSDGFIRLALSRTDAQQAQAVLNGLLLHLNALSQQFADTIQIKISEV